jgi:hypothetical protein
MESMCETVSEMLLLDAANVQLCPVKMCGKIWGK